MAKKKFYVTTPIYYANAAPHIGSAYTTIAADILARWHKLLGEDVYFLTGTDEHGLKIQRTAQAAGKNPKEFVDEIAEKFKKAWQALNIHYNYFIRTTDKDHEKDVQTILQELFDKKLIYKGYYEAYYCVGCEQYLTKSELIDGKCPIHKIEPEIKKEEAYLFKLSAFQKKILSLIQTNKLEILPKNRKNEIINFVKEGLQDISFSRKKSEVPWGIELPFNKEHTAYVWVDALWNYITGLRDKKIFEKFWPADIQLMAKDIFRVHATIWIALLLALKYKLPKTFFIHGYFTVGGQKISKSLGNTINPVILADKYGSDSIRYFLMRNIPFGEDGDFSEQALAYRHNNELANKLGNLISRVSALAEKYGLEKSDSSLDIKQTKEKFEKSIENYEFDKALNEVFAFIDKCNEYIQNKKPWETQNKKVLYELADAIKDFTILLSPFIPETAEKIAKIFNFQVSYKEINKPLKIKSIKKSDILFKKV